MHQEASPLSSVLCQLTQDTSHLNPLSFLHFTQPKFMVHSKIHPSEKVSADRIKNLSDEQGKGEGGEFTGNLHYKIMVFSSKAHLQVYFLSEESTETELPTAF